MSVKQFSAVYSPLEDRILFGFNTSENELFQFWLTRAIAKSVIDQSDVIAERSLTDQHSERSSKLIAEFQKEGLKKQLSFEESFEGGEKSPLGDDPILVAQAQFKLEGEEVAISLTLASNQAVGFSLLVGQLQAVALLIEKLAEQAQWQITGDIVANLESGVSAVVAASSQVH
jgi:hypothetical protein